MKKFLHDWIGFAAATMLVAALLYCLAPHTESFLGAERARILFLILLGLFAIYGGGYFLRFLGLIARRKD